MSSTPPKRRTRILREFYGLDDAKPVKPKENRRDPLDLDSPAFEGSRWVSKMLTNAKPADVLTQDNQLMTQIKEIDGEMKTLVYENYSKFISASDTIRNMNDTVDTMDTEMSKLQSHLSQITTVANGIHEALDGRRKRLHQLNGVHTVLEKLQFILALPQRLGDCLIRNALGEAVSHWNKTSTLLLHYNHVAAFKSIDEECKGIMKEVKKRIEQGLEKNTSVDLVSEHVSWLLSLKEDAKKLWPLLLKSIEGDLQKSHDEAVENMSGTSVEKAHAWDTYLQSIGQRCQQFNNLFNSKSIDASLLESAQQDLDTIVQNVAHVYFSQIHTLISEAPLQQVPEILSNMLSIISSNPSLVKLGLDDDAQRLAMTWLRQLVNNMFGTILLEFLKKLDGEDVHEIVLWLSHELSVTLLTNLESLAPVTLLNQLSDGKLELLEVVRVELRLFWQELLDGICWMVDKTTSFGLSPNKAREEWMASRPSITPSQTIFLTKFVEQLPVDNVYNLFASKLWQRPKTSKRGEIIPGEEVLADSREVLDQITSICQKLVKIYISDIADQVSKLGLQGDFDGLTRDLTFQRDVLAKYFDVPSRSGSPNLLKAGSNMNATLLNKASQGLFSELDKVFSEKIEWYPSASTQITLDKSSIMAVILRIVFKTLLENERMEGGLGQVEQVQNNVDKLKTWLLSSGVQDRTMLMNLLDEIVLASDMRQILFGTTKESNQTQQLK